MKRTLIAGLIICAALTLTAAGQKSTAQKPQAAEKLLGAAIHQEEAEGNLEAAIASYKKFLSQYGSNRPLAAKAQYHLGLVYEKLGNAEARKAYELVVSNFADQKEVAADAGRRLATLEGGRSTDTLTARLVWSGDVIDASASMTPDGRLLAMRDPATGDIAIRDMSTSQIKRLMAKAGSWNESPEFGNFPVLSPDLRQVVYEWNDGSNPATFQLRVMPNDVGGKPRVLLSSPEFLGPLPSAWSQDGKSILALVWKQDKTGQLVWVSVADGTVKVLKSLDWRLSGRTGMIGASVTSRPSISPDGQYIAYTAYDRPDLESSIYIIAADGSRENVLVKTGGINESPIWTPDGKHVVYTSNRSGTFGLWSIAVQDGKSAGDPIRVKAAIGRTPAVAFIRSGSYYYLNYGEAEVGTFLADLDQTNGKIRGPAVRLESSFGSDNPAMTWSPDSKSIALARNSELVVLSIETGETHVMKPTSPMRLAGSIMWSRDGKTLLQAVRDTQSRLFFDRVDLKTGEFKEVLATGATSNSLESALSPDERTVYTNAGTAIAKGNGSTGIAAFDLATGQKRQVFIAKEDGLVPGLGLSPDGRTLAFKLYYAGKPRETHLCTIGVDGGNFRDLYAETEPGDGSLRPQLAWTKDGRTILFTRATDDGWQLMRIPTDGGKPEFTGLAGKGRNTNIDLNADGSRIAFNNSVSSENAELWALDNLISVLKAAH